MSNNTYFGWTLLYNSVASVVKSNEDVLVCLTHYVLTANGFECIGIGDSKNMDGTEPKSEALPAGWNDNYHLRYVYQGRLYLLQGNVLDDGIMINLIRTDERTTSMIQLNSRIVLRRTGSIDDMIPNNKEVVKQIKEQLIDKVTVSSKCKDNASQTVHQATSAHESRSTSGIPDLTVPPRGMPRVYQDPFGVGLGRDDLDPLGGLGGGFPGFGPGGSFNPLGGGGGGMLFQPPSRFEPIRPGSLPPGSIPPGARFDPFSPPDVNGPQPRRPNRPDNDELPPPGFDDMYM